MEKKIISQGAEAIIYSKEDNIVKKRIPKKYRLKELDDKIRKSRTKTEKKILQRAKKIIFVPEVLEKNTNEYEIEMKLIKGEKLSENLNNFDIKKQKNISKKIGIAIGKLHDEGIIHSDLTTSNMIYFNSEVYLIDFGLSKLNGKIEDKAVDLYLLKKAFDAKHFKTSQELFKSAINGYISSNKKDTTKIIERLLQVEKRGRYKRAKEK